MSTAQFGMIGLGTMGRNLLLNIADHNIIASGYDRNPDQQKRLIEEGKDKSIIVTASMQEFVNSLATPRKIMMLVPAGKIVDAVIDEISPLLQAGDILIDGGNSHYTDTDLRIEKLKSTGIHFTGMGVSGGEEGARFGPSMMPGGTIESYQELKSTLEKIAAQTTDGPCVTFVGNGSAGHYTKMVHNGIEYAIMQLISEVYAILKNVGNCTNLELNQIFGDWNKGKLQSFLIEITEKIFLEKDDLNPDKDLVDVILDRAAQKGTGMWTTESALELHIPTPTIDQAVTARDVSAFKNERVQIASFTNNITPNTINKETLINDLQNALEFGITVSYIQGLHLLKAASATYNYNINISEVVRIWKGGCIIRSVLLNDLQTIYAQNNDLTNLLLDKNFYTQLIQNRTALINSINIGMQNNIGLPALSSALSYVNMFSTARLSSNLIQAQRDLFGAHTYERIDKEGSFHTNWK